MSRTWKRNDPRRQKQHTPAVRCPSGKTGWSQAVAQAKLDTYSTDGNRQRVPQRIYRCPLCDHWHTTSKPDKRAA